MPPQGSSQSEQTLQDVGFGNENEEVEENTLVSDEKDIVLPSFGCSQEPIRMNHNVFLNLVLAVLYGLSGSLWNGTAYAAYLKKLGHNRNGPLGDIEAVSGLATLFTALCTRRTTSSSCAARGTSSAMASSSADELPTCDGYGASVTVRLFRCNV